MSVSDREIETDAKAMPLTEEEQEFLRQHRKMLRSVQRQPEELLAELFARAARGEAEAKKLLTEHYMERVLELAQEHIAQGLPLPDLVQEGSLGLMMGLNTLGLLEEGMSAELYLEQEIRRAIRSALDIQEGERSKGEQVAERLNRLMDSIEELKEDLGGAVTPGELSLYLDMPLEEIEDLLRLAGENIGEEEPGK